MDDDNFAEGWPKATVALIGRKSFLTLPYEEHPAAEEAHGRAHQRLRRAHRVPGLHRPHCRVHTLRGCSDDEAGGEIEFLTELRRMTFKIIVQIFLTAADDAPGGLAILVWHLLLFANS
jgi:ent-kaurenoic acid hydroxylase